MSLTSHLENRRSPVRAWFEQNFGETRSVVLAANEVLCGKPRQPCLLQPPSGCDVGLVGTAVDYLVRAVLRPGALEQTVARKGATSLGAGGVRLEREAVAAIEQLDPCDLPPTDDGLRHLCRMCLVLARFEQLFRAGLFVIDYIYAALVDDATLDLYAERVVPASCLDDLLGLAPAAIEDHQDLASAEPLVLNPTFALSVALGGADADLIASGLLLDLKSTASPRGVLKREDIWQLVGYLMADSHDEYAIHAVGISALRRRRWVTWPVDDLLTMLSGKPNHEVVAWRADFAENAAPLQRAARRQFRTASSDH
jgi:hypothetical protein